MKRAWLFTGQGFQYPQMLHQLPSCGITHRILGLASEILGYDVKNFDTAEHLKSNLHTQICIYLSEVVLAEILSQQENCQIVSGHSIGSFAAAVCAKVLSFEDGIRMVQKRGQKMEHLFGYGYGMLAVQGLTYSLCETLQADFNGEFSDVLQKNQGSCVYLAIQNEEQQCVFSGKMEALKKFETYIHSLLPAKTHYIQVKVPSHCTLMHPVTELLEAEARQIIWNTPSLPVLTNSTARRTVNLQKIKRDLITGAQYPVRWYDGITVMKELGIEEFTEISQSETLTRIGRNCYGTLQWKHYPISTVFP